MTFSKSNILLSLLMFFFTQVYGQQDILEKRIDIQFEDQTVKEALKKLMRKHDCNITYQPSSLPKDRRISLSFTQTPIATVIQKVWGSDQLEFRSRDNEITLRAVLKNKENTKTGKLLGLITNYNKEPIAFATVAIKSTTKGVISDYNGRFTLSLNEGLYSLLVSSTGYKPKEVKAVVKAGNSTQVNISLEESVNALEEVVVKGKSFTQEMAEEPIAINTINAIKLQEQTHDVAKVLDKVEGVRIRQSGGLGSQTSISINGLTGNAIRFYYNGIPSEFLGGGFQLNTLPISNVDRIEVYKGVMPANIGTDALGGGVNIATNQENYPSTDFSYQYGSFNTHRIAGSITRPINKRWFYHVNANYNYSDNDYEMEVRNNTYDPSLSLPTGIETIRVRRFHDAFSSFLGHANVGYRNEDRKLSVNAGIYLTTQYKELQNGVQVGLVPFGEATLEGQDTYLKFDLEKKFNLKWKINYSGIVGYSRNMVTDSTLFFYDWNGQNITLLNPAISRNSGAELLGRASISDIFNYNTVQRAALKYEVIKDFSISLHHFFAFQDRKGTEKIEANFIGGRDPNETGFQIARNITSIETKKHFFDQKLEVLTTAKSYQYTTEGINTTITGIDPTDDLPIETNKEHAWGYNAAVKYKWNNNYFIRLSYENALRIPSQAEVFGDLQNIVPNFRIRPERSNNLNAGINADISQPIRVSFNYFYRSQRDLIFLNIIDENTAQFINRDKVQSTGVEISLRGAPFKRFTYSWNVTRFNVKIKSVSNMNDRFLLGAPLPNRPTFFSNLGLTYTWEDFMVKGRRLTLSIDGQFIDEFSFIQDGSIRNDDNWVPVQYALDVGFTYHFLERLSFNFQANNIFDSALFDFINVPKPGRNFAMKLRYNY